MFKFFNALGHLLVLAVALRTGEPASSSDIAKVEEGYLKVSREIEKQINDQKFDFLDQLLSYDLVFERTALNIPAKMKTELSSELKGMLAKMLANTIQKPFTFKLLRIFLQRGETRAWFRLLNEKGFVYYQFVFKASNHGSIKIADFYSSSTGEWMSEFLRSSMLPYFANDTNAKLSPEDREILNHAEEIQKMRLLAQAGKWPEALEAYRRMPDLLQSNKMLLRSGSAARAWFSRDCHGAARPSRWPWPPPPARAPRIGRNRVADRFHQPDLLIAIGIEPGVGKLALALPDERTHRRFLARPLALQHAPVRS